ncbi:MAG: 5-formyltetrahydrofolate cyclo-ligase [Lachnospiraceae bacterium]|nr:5-formyltetrahydrofolate cyclo-ligase [Lachnospiraceae bacterium]
MTEDIGEKKKRLRAKILKIRDALSEEEILERSRLIKEGIKALPEFQKAKRILLYASFRSEVSTYELMEELLSKGEKEVFLPVVMGKELRFYRIFSGEETKKGYMGIPEPSVRDESRLFLPGDPPEDTAVILPGSVFDEHGGRIGYGGGFYDRFLKEVPGVTAIGAAFGFQVIKEDLPAGKWDIKADYAVTETGVFTGSRIG